MGLWARIHTETNQICLQWEPIRTHLGPGERESTKGGGFWTSDVGDRAVVRQAGLAAPALTASIITSMGFTLSSPKSQELRSAMPLLLKTAVRRWWRPTDRSRDSAPRPSSERTYEVWKQTFRTTMPGSHLHGSRSVQWIPVPIPSCQFVDIINTHMEVELNCFLVIEIDKHADQCTHHKHTMGWIFTNRTHPWSSVHIKIYSMPSTPALWNFLQVSFQVTTMPLPTEGNCGSNISEPTFLVWFFRLNSSSVSHYVDPIWELTRSLPMFWRYYYKISWTGVEEKQPQWILIQCKRLTPYSQPGVASRSNSDKDHH